MRTAWPLIVVFLFSSFISNAQGIYTDVNPDVVKYFGVSDFDFDIDKDGTNDLQFHYDYIGLGITVEIQTTNSTYISIHEGSPNWVDTLAFGIEINENLNWTSSTSSIRDFSGENPLWWGIDNMMVGVMKVDGPDKYFCWFRIGLTSTHKLTIYDYSFNPIPDEPIFAGNDAKFVASEISVTDTTDNLNGTDLYVSARQALYWDELLEYRLIAVKSENAGLFDLEQAVQLADDRYLVIPFDSQISTTFLSGSKDADGDLIGPDLYTVFILSMITADSSVLSNPSAEVSLFLLPDAVDQILGADIGDFGDGRDLQIDFGDIADETVISEYRVFVVPYLEADNFTVDLANGLSEDRYTEVGPIGAPIQIQLTESSLTINGNGIGSGGYRIFVMSVANGF